LKDSSCTPNCYPAAVNYTPTYFLINGKWFDQTAPLNSAFAIPETALSGNVLLRLLNAGLRTHTPVVAGQAVTLLAEDGNVLPGKSRDQNEVLLPAGKTHDVLIHPLVAVAAVPPATGKYAPATNGILDRQLSLTTNNQPNGGQQGFLQIAGGTLPSAVTPLAVNDSFQIPFSSAFNGNVTTNDVAVTSEMERLPSSWP